MFDQGFLGTRATAAIDIMGIAIILVVPIQLFSLYLIRRRQYQRHKQLQVTIASIMTVAVITFEIQIRLFGWRHLAEESAYYDSYLLPALLVHLIFAIPAFLLWVVTIYGALKNFAKPPLPSDYSIIHKRLGKFSVVMTLGTCITAWLFYWLAFVT